MRKANWKIYSKGMLPIIVLVLAIIIFNGFRFFIKSTVNLVEESYSLGYKLGDFLEKIF